MTLREADRAEVVDWQGAQLTRLGNFLTLLRTSQTSPQNMMNLQDSPNLFHLFLVIFSTKLLCAFPSQNGWATEYRSHQEAE